MHQPIDVEQFLAELADDDHLATELHEVAIAEINVRLTHIEKRRAEGRFRTAASPKSVAREHTIDALIEVAASPLSEIDRLELWLNREVLGAVLDDFLVNVHRIDIDKLERRLREMDGDL